MRQLTVEVPSDWITLALVDADSGEVVANKTVLAVRPGTRVRKRYFTDGTPLGDGLVVAVCTGTYRQCRVYVLWSVVPLANPRGFPTGLDGVQGTA